MPRKCKPQGRLSKVTPEITAAVCNALTALCKHETAANLAGIGLRTFYDWRRWGQDRPRGPYGDFSRAVRGAEAKAQQSLSASVALGARTDGRLALEALHARWPKLWPKSERREITGANGGPMEFNVDDRTDLLDRINRIATQGAAREVHPRAEPVPSSRSKA